MAKAEYLSFEKMKEVELFLVEELRQRCCTISDKWYEVQGRRVDENDLFYKSVQYHTWIHGCYFESIGFGLFEYETEKVIIPHTIIAFHYNYKERIKNLLENNLFKK